MRSRRIRHSRIARSKMRSHRMHRPHVDRRIEELIPLLSDSRSGRAIGTKVVTELSDNTHYGTVVLKCGGVVYYRAYYP
jgi:hypothetical protein